MKTLVAALVAFLLGAALGWKSWSPLEAPPAPSVARTGMPAATQAATARVAAAAPSLSAPASALPSLANRESPDAKARWRHAQFLDLCTRQKQLGTLWKADPGMVERQLKPIGALIDNAEQRWRDTPEDERTALRLDWLNQVVVACAALPPVDAETMYRAQKDAALQGPRDAALAYVNGAPLATLSFGKHLDIWTDWAATAPAVLNDLVAAGDREALFLRAVAEGFSEHTSMRDVWKWGRLINATPDDPPQAYRDMRRYIASGDTAHHDLALQLLPLLAAALDPTELRALDAEPASP